MKILQINKFHFINGGTDKYYLDISRELEARGFEVVNFAMEDERNMPSPSEKYFVSNKDFSLNSNGHTSLLEKLVFRTKQAVMNIKTMIWSTEAAHALEEMIMIERPDVAHIHNIYHQISPSILPVLKKHKIPVVMTAHDWNLVSCNYVRYHHGEVCSHTLNKNFLNAVRHKCVKDSRIASLISAMTHSVHKLARVNEKHIDHIIFPSETNRDGHINARFDMKDSSVLANYIDVNQYTPNTNPGNYLLSVGRLSDEKGLDTLVDAMHILKKGSLNHLTLKIVGGGVLEQELKHKIKELGLEDRVEVLGQKPYTEVLELMANASCFIFTSRALENMPLVLIEAMALGKPIIASKIGGVPEIVNHEQTGLLVTPGDSQELAEAIHRLLSSPETIVRYGKAGREKAEQLYSKEKHFSKLEWIYSSLID